MTTKTTNKRCLNRPNLDSVIFNKRIRLNPNTIINLISPIDLEHVILLSSNLEVERMMMFSIMDTIYRALPTMAHREIKYECEKRNDIPTESQLSLELKTDNHNVNLERFEWKKNDKRLVLARTEWLNGTKLLFKHPAYYLRYVFHFCATHKNYIFFIFLGCSVPINEIV